jgi:hypothetical protein
MNKDQIIAKIKEQDFPDGTYVAFGSCPLAVAGIRPSEDIDLVVSPVLYTLLQQRGWRIKLDQAGVPMLYNDDFEICKCWTVGTYRATFEDLKASAEVVEGIPFVKLSEVVNWKKTSDRPKDKEDIGLIKTYMHEHGHGGLVAV